MDILRLAVPGTLLYRGVVLRAVASVCRVVRRGAQAGQATSHRNNVEDFDDKVVSAVSEAFNNIAIHAYKSTRGEAELELGFEQDKLTVRLLDTGEGFNFSAELGQALEILRESRMGLEIMLACMDEVSYARGGPMTPNVLTMTKRYHGKATASNRGD
jgi:serine/threonine-protein kinase RsbW